MEPAKVKVPYTNERVYPGGQFGFHEPSPIKAGTQRGRRRNHRQVYSAAFREWMLQTCGPANYGLYRHEKYYVKRGREVDQTIAGVSSLSRSAQGEIFEFANPRHAVLFKLTWGGF